MANYIPFCSWIIFHQQLVSQRDLSWIWVESNGAAGKRAVALQPIIEVGLLPKSSENGVIWTLSLQRQTQYSAKSLEKFEKPWENLERKKMNLVCFSKLCFFAQILVNWCEKKPFKTSPWKTEVGCFLAVPRQLYRFPCHSLTHSLTHWLTDCLFWKTLPKSTLRDLWPLRHVIRVTRRHELTNKHCQRHNGPRNWLRDLD